MKTGIIALSLLAATTVHAGSEYAVAFSDKGVQYGNTNKIIRLVSHNGISVTNPTDRVIGWNYLYEICVGGERGCHTEKYIVNVEPHHNFQDFRDIYFDVSFKHPSDFVITSHTQVIGDVREYSDEKYSYGTLHVTE